MRATVMNNARGKYVEDLTAEIFNTLFDVLNADIDDRVFLKAQERVRKLIDREFVEIADRAAEKVQKKRGPKARTVSGRKVDD